MSHIVEIEVKFKDLEGIKAAAERLGFEFLENQKTYKWYGTWVGDTAMPDGLTVADLGHCEHAIRVPGADYEIGVARSGEDWTLRWDWWSSGGLLKPMGGEKGDRFTQAYAVEEMKLVAQRRGDAVMSEQVMEDGTVRLMLEAR